MFSILHEKEQQHVPRSCLSVYVSAELLGRERQQASNRARRSTRYDVDVFNLTGKAEHAAPWPSALGMAKVPVAPPLVVVVGAGGGWGAAMIQVGPQLVPTTRPA